MIQIIDFKKHKLFQSDVNDCVKTICSLLEPSNGQKYFLDLGCNDGSKTIVFAASLGIKNNFTVGADINYKLLKCAKGNEINPIKCNFDRDLPFKSETFDVIVSNQVIEHLSDTDLFLRNVYRVLKKNGYAIIGTENISYWANIVVMFFGYQAFSQNISDYFHVGNPLSRFGGPNFPEGSAMDTHKRIFSIRGLPALLTKYNFKIESVLGAGFAPLPSFLAKCDKIHARFLVVKARKIS